MAMMGGLDVQCAQVVPYGCQFRTGVWLVLIERRQTDLSCDTGLPAGADPRCHG